MGDDHYLCRMKKMYGIYAVDKVYKIPGVYKTHWNQHENFSNLSYFS